MCLLALAVAACSTNDAAFSSISTASREVASGAEDIPSAPSPTAQTTAAASSTAPQTAPTGAATSSVRSVQTAALDSTEPRPPPVKYETGSVAGAQDTFDVVTVLWGTNRKQTKVGSLVNGKGSRPRFGADRSDALTLGYSKITVPKKDRQVGSIPLARQYTVLNLTVYKDNENPAEHFTIRDASVIDVNEFAKLAGDIDARAKNFKGHAFVFVHGYWNEFDDALYRTAQLAYDMGFDGAPYFFSWPSEGTLKGYLYDRESVDSSQAHFLGFLQLVAARTNAQKIHVIAHSMGSRLVVDTLFPAIGTSRVAQLGKIDQIILAAADIDQAALRAREAAVKDSVRTLTLYASNSDEALQLSRSLAGNQARAGDVMDGVPFIMPGIETVDISNMSTLVFISRNHGKFAEKAHILKDIALLMKHGVHPPDSRFPVFESAEAPAGKYWRYVSN